MKFSALDFKRINNFSAPDVGTKIMSLGQDNSYKLDLIKSEKIKK